MMGWFWSEYTERNVMEMLVKVVSVDLESLLCIKSQGSY